MIKQKYQVFNSKIADVGISETPSPLESANVGILDPPPPLKTADVLYGRLGNAACRPPRSALPIEFLVLSQSFLFRPQCSLFIGYYRFFFHVLIKELFIFVGMNYDSV